MGNSSSTHRERPETHVDFGSLKPFGTYSAQQDWNEGIVAQLIKDRKLAPFYWPLEDYEDDWDDEQVMAARKQLPSETPAPGNGSDSAHETSPSSPTKSTFKHSRKDGMRIPEAQLYRPAVECPICFLWYPPNINRSRCCDHYLCTECFVQIKRADPTPTHLVSEPAACPYCMQENFGVTYTPPQWRSGIGSEGFPSPELYKVTSGSSLNPPRPTAGKSRRKSVSHTSSDVVTIDQIRPDWEAKLAAVRAAVARRANRRIIMRQVGDRLIPVGISSGRIQINPEGAAEAAAGEGGDETAGGGRRRRARDLNQLLGSMGMAGQDLEELMVMEAMRLSLLEHEESQRRQQQQTGSSTGAAAAPSLSSSAPTRTLAMPVPRPSAFLHPPSGSTASAPSSAPNSPSPMSSSPPRLAQPRLAMPTSPLGPSTSRARTPRNPSPLRAAGGSRTPAASAPPSPAPIASPSPLSSAPPAPPTPTGPSRTPIPRTETVMTASSMASEDPAGGDYQQLLSPDLDGEDHDRLIGPVEATRSGRRSPVEDTSL